MGCQKTLTIQPAQDDMPLDQAVYDSVSDKIFGVRAGYVYEFSPTTGSKIQSSRYAVPAWSDASIAFDPVNNKIFCTVWNEKSQTNGGNAAVTKMYAKRLYQINPVDLSLITSVEVNGNLPAWPDYVGQSSGAIIEGPHRILYYGGVLICVNYNAASNSPGIVKINPATLLYTVEGDDCGWVYSGGWNDFCIQPAGSENAQVWMVKSFTEWNTVETLDWVTLKNSDSAYWYHDAQDTTPDLNIYGVCWCDANSKVYGVCRNQFVVSITPNLIAGPWVDPAVINTGDSTATPYRVCYNPYDGLIYIPTYKSNNVLVLDPATETIVATYTGFDSPFDCVFTPTKKWCVQQGSVPLRLIA